MLHDASGTRKKGGDVSRKECAEQLGKFVQCIYGTEWIEYVHLISQLALLYWSYYDVHADRRHLVKLADRRKILS